MISIKIKINAIVIPNSATKGTYTYSIIIALVMISIKNFKILLITDITDFLF